MIDEVIIFLLIEYYIEIDWSEVWKRRDRVDDVLCGCGKVILIAVQLVMLRAMNGDD